ncbi:hypothetical protein CDL12_21881 [Handroanthus impetiginosus]|uniref:Uncharacterized protein n=1 Tax=Handroanthus impetiginosus TaxID=429701 RepID=A0A2G9GK48_9LAMI|nr:hypothetical protein CDL12_21881 [Handroanthus impetiginosus]
MAPKRKLEINAVIDESQRALFYTFQNTANNLSLFYNQCVDNQELAYKAGQKYAIVNPCSVCKLHCISSGISFVDAISDGGMKFVLVMEVVF